MASITTNTNTRDTFFANLRASIADAFHAAVQMRQYRATVTQLSALSTRELDDLGIARCEIKYVARTAVYGV
ncbi:DUF1127 domain-containing protein [Neptunicoccus cionae]|uniref:DUF1127 domain-containing protein n=1 Tax=Neptunicoccus cionae TaxID=2035344 RepID=UPI000C789947|nr:DUF1127 domain-containing protein [Amylibacter cionae]PLS23482.1 hypothetical protein C0U40_05040 [Amylibacter cionae]